MSRGCRLLITACSAVLFAVSASLFAKQAIAASSDARTPTEFEPISQPLLQQREASNPTHKEDSTDTSGARLLGAFASGLPHSATGTVVTSAAIPLGRDLSEMIRYFRTRPDREKFAGLVQLLEVADGYGRPGHQERVRALPVRVERGPVESRDGRRGMVKRYVHRSGAAREIFWPLGPSDIPSPVPALEAEISLLSDDLHDSESMDRSEVGGRMGTEWCEHDDPEDGDLSSDCASEQEVDDFFAYMVTSDAEMVALENDVNYEMGTICQAMSQSSNPPQEFYEYCNVPLASNAAGPFSAAPTPVLYPGGMAGDYYGAESSDILQALASMSAPAVNCENLAETERASCLMAAASAMWGVAVAIVGIDRTLDKGMTWWLSRGYRIAGRAVAVYAGATAVGVAFAVYGAYQFYDCVTGD